MGSIAQDRAEAQDDSISPSPRVDPAPPRRPRAPSGFAWLRAKLSRSRRRTSPEPEVSLTCPSGEVRAAGRRFSVEVRDGHAAIVEILDWRDGSSQVRRLREQFLPHDKRSQADRLKWRIVFEENAATYGHSGLYSSRSESAADELLALVEDMERRDGPQAWDRRRYPR